MSTLRLSIYIGLLLVMLAGVVALAITMPTLPHIALVVLFAVGFYPLIRTALRLHREHRKHE